MIWSRTVLGAGVLALLATAGCGGGTATSAPTSGSSATPAPPTATATVTVTAPPSGAGASATGGSSGGSGTAQPGRCPNSSLHVGWTEAKGGAAAGSTYLVLTFQNSGSQACYLDGHPGVSFVGHGNGTQLGKPAVRKGTIAKVVVKPGASTGALLQVTNAGNLDPSTCDPTTADGLRVYPPGSHASVFVKYPATACQDPSSGSLLTIWPVGHQG